MADLAADDLAKLIKQVEREMKEAAKALEFERAAALRDQLMELRALQINERSAQADLTPAGPACPPRDGTDLHGRHDSHPGRD